MRKSLFEKLGGRAMAGVVVTVLVALIGWIWLPSQGDSINQSVKSTGDGDRINQQATNSGVNINQNIEGYGNNGFINSPGAVVNYTDTKSPNYLNPREDFLKGRSPQDLTILFFELQNENKYREACSLLVKKKKDAGCNSAVGINISDFSIQAKKFVNGYENIHVIPLMTGEYDQSICVKYSYFLKADSNPAQIREYYTYDWEKREDGERELASRICEGITKIGTKPKDCPYMTQNKRCYDLLK